MATSFAYCTDVVQNGHFDATVADRGQQQNGPQAERPVQQLQPPSQQVQPRQSTGITIVADSEYPSRPWR